MLLVIIVILVVCIAYKKWHKPDINSEWGIVDNILFIIFSL